MEYEYGRSNRILRYRGEWKEKFHPKESSPLINYRNRLGFDNDDILDCKDSVVV